MIAIIMAIGILNGIPACEWEDGSGQAVCVWDADTQGNGQGNDVLIIGGADGLVITL